MIGKEFGVRTPFQSFEINMNVLSESLLHMYFWLYFHWIFSSYTPCTQYVQSTYTKISSFYKNLSQKSICERFREYIMNFKEE